jgi:hypothetical protein
MASADDRHPMRVLIDISKQWLGPGFENEARLVRVRRDADAEECKKALDSLVRHLTAGEIESAANDGIDVGAIFEVASDEE